MFTQLEPRDIATEGVLQSNEFTIKANGKAFKVLIDGLYSDKIRSIIRELWSNAYDSHIAANKPDVPFDCQLPTSWEPEFRVRDYGVSLSHDDVMHLYTTVFESTKEGTNDQVGKLGLGSKSPFAYTDTFTVTTWRDGKKRIYSAFIGATYVPTIALLGEEDTDEAQGLEVAFPVQTDDIYSFKVAAERVSRGFDVLPTISGAELKPDAREVLYSGEGWTLYADSIGAQAKQGCVIYPIDPYMVTGADSHQQNMLSASLFIDFPVGDLEIAASREGLGYTQETCRNILTQVDRISAEIRDKILNEEFVGYATYWDACKHYADKKRLSLPNVVKNLIDTLTHRTRPLKTNWYVSDPSIRKIDNEVARGFRVRNKGGWDGTQQFYVNPLSQVILFHDASKKITRVKDRLKHFYETTPGLRDNRFDIVVVRGVPGSFALKRALIALGRAPITAHVADLPLPPKVEKAPRKTVRLKAFKPQNYVSSWNEVETDIDAGGLYVMLDRFTPQITINGEEKDSCNQIVRDAYMALKSLGMISEDAVIYGVPKTLKHIPRKHKHWRCLWDVVRDVLTIGFDAARIERHNVLESALCDIHATSVGSLCKRWMRECRAPGGQMGLLMTRYSVIAADAQALRDQEQYQALAQLFPVDYPIAVTPTNMPADLDLSDLITKVTQAYPLMQDVLMTSLNADNSQRLFDYVNLLDSTVNVIDVSADIEEAA